MRSLGLVLLGLVGSALLAACAAGSDNDTTSGASPTSSAGGAGGTATSGNGGSALAPNGTPCAGASECGSGSCVDGVCCDESCGALCTSCNLSGSEGTCAPIPAGDDPAGECGTVGCDGMGACAHAAHQWSAIYGGLGEEVVLDATLDASGNVVLCGYVESDIDFGGGELMAYGARDIFVAKLDPGGAHLWSKVIGETTGSTAQVAHACATDSLERVIVVGSFAGSIDFGGGALTGNGDAFVVVYNAFGAHVWSKAYPHGGAAISARAARDVIVDGGDDLIVAGEFTGNMNIDGNILEDGSGTEKSLFLAKLTDTGTHLWSKVIGTAAAEQLLGGLAATPAGDVLLAASMEGVVSFGVTSHTSAGSLDVLVARFDANGNHLWSKRFGDALAQEAHGIALDTSGNVVLTGAFDGELNFGGGTLTSAGGYDVFVTALDAAGTHLWSQSFGGLPDQRGLRVAIDSQDNVIVTGSFAGSIDFGGGALMSAGSDDLFLLKLTSDGDHAWSKRNGDGAPQRSAALVAAPDDRLFLAAVVEGSITFGGRDLVSSGQEDVAIALLGP